jgi:hypothetical protein
MRGSATGWPKGQGRCQTAALDGRTSARTAHVPARVLTGQPKAAVICTFPRLRAQWP